MLGRLNCYCLDCLKYRLVVIIAITKLFMKKKVYSPPLEWKIAKRQG